MRHGAKSERVIQTGIGPIAIQQQKVRNRTPNMPSSSKIQFKFEHSAQMGRAGRTAWLPVLYLRGVSMGDLSGGVDGPSRPRGPEPVARHIRASDRAWQAEYDCWQRRDLSARRYGQISADGLCLQAQIEPEAECVLVIIGATPESKQGASRFPCGRPGKARKAGGSCLS